MELYVLILTGGGIIGSLVTILLVKKGTFFEVDFTQKKLTLDTRNEGSSKRTF